LLIAPTTCSATGSTRTRQTPVVSSIQSARLQAAVVVIPDGCAVVLARVGFGGSGAPGDVGGELPVHRPVVRLHQGLHLAHQCAQVEIAQVRHPAGRAEQALEGCALERVRGVLVRLVRGVAGVVAHASKLPGSPSHP
jgi:hypothetical protein